MKIVCVTSCATGIAHTYMAAEALEQALADRPEVEVIHGNIFDFFPQFQIDVGKAGHFGFVGHDTPGFDDLHGEHVGQMFDVFRPALGQRGQLPVLPWRRAPERRIPHRRAR